MAERGGSAQGGSGGSPKLGALLGDDRGAVGGGTPCSFAVGTMIADLATRLLLGRQFCIGPFDGQHERRQFIDVQAAIRTNSGAQIKAIGSNHPDGISHVG